MPEVETIVEKDTKTVQNLKEPEKYQVIFINENYKLDIFSHEKTEIRLKPAEFHA